MKLIDAEKLIAEIERLNSLVSYESKDRHDEGLHDAYKAIKNVIYSLYQEQPDFPTTDEQMKEFLATHPKIKVPEKYKNPDWLWKRQEQPEVDLEKDVESWFFNEISSKINIENTMYYYFQECARRYFELGKNSK